MHKFFDHTGDLGIEVHGKTLKDIFINSAYALISYQTDISKIESKEKINISLKEADIETLFVGLLNEILYYTQIKKFLPNKIELLNLEKNSINMNLAGEYYNEKKHILKGKEIKAVTYHKLEIKKTTKGFSAKFICDL
jgi:SHS2 domain-containing protein